MFWIWNNTSTQRRNSPHKMSSLGNGLEDCWQTETVQTLQLHATSSYATNTGDWQRHTHQKTPPLSSLFHIWDKTIFFNCSNRFLLISYLFSKYNGGKDYINLLSLHLFTKETKRDNSLRDSKIWGQDLFHLLPL